MYEVIFPRLEKDVCTTMIETIEVAFKDVADMMGKEVSELRFTPISLIGDKEDADWVVDYYGKIVAVIIKK